MTPPASEGYAPFEGHETWYRVVGDLRAGSGDGPAPLVTLHGGAGPRSSTARLLKRELASLVEHLGIGDRYHVLGQSWGGMLAQEHAIDRPPGLRSVILSNTAASLAGLAGEADGPRAAL